MFSIGWFWIAVVMFVFMAPKWRRRRGRWESVDGWDVVGDRSGPRERPQPQDTERKQQRDEQVEQLEARVAELESRLDFAERLLAPRRDPAISPPPRL